MEPASSTALAGERRIHSMPHCTLHAEFGTLCLIADVVHFEIRNHIQHVGCAWGVAHIRGLIELSIWSAVDKIAAELS